MKSEINNLRNNKKIVQELGTKIKDQDRDLGFRDTLLGIGTKIGTVSKLQVRNKNEKAMN